MESEALQLATGYLVENNGAYFDVKAKTSCVIRQVQLRCGTYIENGKVSLYSCKGTAVGKEDNASVWEKVGEGILPNKDTLGEVLSCVVPMKAGEVRGFLAIGLGDVIAYQLTRWKDGFEYGYQYTFAENALVAVSGGKRVSGHVPFTGTLRDWVNISGVIVVEKRPCYVVSCHEHDGLVTCTTMGGKMLGEFPVPEGEVPYGQWIADAVGKSKDFDGHGHDLRLVNQAGDLIDVSNPLPPMTIIDEDADGSTPQKAAPAAANAGDEKHEPEVELTWAQRLVAGPALPA